MRVFRSAQGKRALLANVPFDAGVHPGSEPGAESDSLSLICSAPTARERLRRLEQLGFDDILLGCPLGSVRHLEMILELAQTF